MQKPQLNPSLVSDLGGTETARNGSASSSQTFTVFIAGFPRPRLGHVPTREGVMANLTQALHAHGQSHGSPLHIEPFFGADEEGRGFVRHAFATFSTEAEADRFVSSSDCLYYQGRQLRLEHAHIGRTLRFRIDQSFSPEALLDTVALTSAERSAATGLDLFRTESNGIREILSLFGGFESPASGWSNRSFDVVFFQRGDAERVHRAFRPASELGLVVNWREPPKGPPGSSFRGNVDGQGPLDDDGNRSAYSIWVTGLREGTTETPIRRAFSDHGEVLSIEWSATRRSGSPFVFVTFDNQRSAQEAVREKNGSFHLGTPLRVEHKWRFYRPEMRNLLPATPMPIVGTSSSIGTQGLEEIGGARRVPKTLQARNERPVMERSQDAKAPITILQRSFPGMTITHTSDRRVVSDPQPRTKGASFDSSQPAAIPRSPSGPTVTVEDQPASFGSASINRVSRGWPDQRSASNGDGGDSSARPAESQGMPPYQHSMPLHLQSVPPVWHYGMPPWPAPPAGPGYPPMMSHNGQRWVPAPWVVPYPAPGPIPFPQDGAAWVDDGRLEVPMFAYEPR